MSIGGVKKGDSLWYPNGKFVSQGASTVVKAIQKFFSHYKTISYQKGRILLRPGDDINTIHLLTKGVVRQYAASPRGEEITIHLYRPGSFFPMALVLAGAANRFYFEADSGVTMKEAPVGHVLKFIREDTNALFDLTTRLSQAIDGLATRIEHGLPLRARERVENLLVYLTERFGEKRLTHKEMASWLGVSRETVSREMSKLRAKK